MGQHRQGLQCQCPIEGTWVLAEWGLGKGMEVALKFPVCSLGMKQAAEGQQ